MSSGVKSCSTKLQVNPAYLVEQPTIGVKTIAVVNKWKEITKIWVYLIGFPDKSTPMMMYPKT